MNRPTLTQWIRGLALTASAVLIYVMYDAFGNTTETNNYTTSAFRWMVSLWSASRIYGGSSNWVGWLTPVAALFVVWRRRGELRTCPKSVYWPAFAALLLSILLHWMGARAQQTRLSLLALVLMLWSIPTYLYGRQVGKKLLFPAALLIYCVPLNFLDAFTFPLRILAAVLAGGLLNGLGIANIRAGSALSSSPPGAYAFDAADSASGLSMLLLVSFIAAMAGWWRHPKASERWLLFISTVPAVLMANVIRLFALSAWSAAFGDAWAVRLNNRYSYILLLLVCLALLQLSSRIIRTNWRGYARLWTENKSSQPSSF